MIVGNNNSGFEIYWKQKYILIIIIYFTRFALAMPYTDHDIL